MLCDQVSDLLEQCLCRCINGIAWSSKVLESVHRLPLRTSTGYQRISPDVQTGLHSMLQRRQEALTTHLLDPLMSVPRFAKLLG